MAQIEAPRLARGFRFHPTDEELVVYYLKGKSYGTQVADGIIGEVDLYKFEPWDLPEKCVLNTRDLVWYFFHAQDKKYPRSSRTNRATVAGYWKTTGKDRRVCSRGRMVGTKKTLVFYLGRAPSGERTDWIMHEYRLDEELEKNRKSPSAFVLCRIRKKQGPGPRNGEQYGAPVLDENDSVASYAQFSSTDRNQTHPEELSENEVQQEHLDDVHRPFVTGGLEIYSQVSKDVGSLEMEGFKSQEEMIFLQRPCEWQDKFLGPAYGPQASSSIEQGLKGEIVSADQFVGISKDNLTCPYGRTASSEPMHISAIETVPRVPNIMDLEVDGLDDLHDILHPDPSEPEMLGEMLDTLLAGQGQTVTTVPNILDLEVGGLDDLHDILHPAPNEAEMLGEMLDALLAGQGQAIPIIDDAVDQNESMSLQSFAYSRDLIGDDYIELADLERSLDEYLLTMPALETDGLAIEEKPSICGDNGIEAHTRSIWPQGQLPGLYEQGSAAWRARFQVSALFNSEKIGGSIYFEDILQHPESTNTVDRQFPSSEVPMITSGEMEDILHIELQDAENMYRSTNRESTFYDKSSGLGLTSDPRTSESQIIKYDQKHNDTFLSDKIFVYAPTECDKVHVQPLQVESVAVVDLPVEDRIIKLEELSSVVKTKFESSLCLTEVNVDSMGILLTDQNQCSHLELADEVLESLPQDIPSSYFAAVSASAGQADTVGSTATVQKDEIVTASMKQENTVQTASASGQDHLAVVNNVVEHLFLVDQRAYPIAATGSPSQLSGFNNSIAAPTLEASSSFSTLSPSQLPKFLLWVIELLGDVPALPASAAEICLDQGQSKPAMKKPVKKNYLDSEVTYSEECLYLCKSQEGHVQATLPLRSTPNKTSSGLTYRVKSDFSRAAKQSSVSPEVYGECLTSNHKMPGLGKILSEILCIKDHRKLCKSLSSGFTTLLFWGATLALIFFCLIRGFCRLRKGALTMIF